MRNIIAYFLFVILCTSCTITGKKQFYTVELLQDPYFKNGLAVSPLSPDIVQQSGGFKNANTDTLYFRQKSCAPIWQLAQWWSRYDLKKSVSIIQAEDNTYTYSNPGKTVRLSGKTLLLDVKASNEYKHPRQINEPWVHLLIQQDFSQQPNIGQLEALFLQMNLRITHCENKMPADAYDESLHTAQSPFYFYLKNNNPQSKDFNSALWVGIPSFDYRYKTLAKEPTIHWDKGTSTYIYTIPPQLLWGDISFHDFKWHKLYSDILPYIRQAVAAMQEKGEFSDTSLNDLIITGMNFGWEIPGTFDAGLEIKNIRIRMQQERRQK